MRWYKPNQCCRRRTRWVWIPQFLRREGISYFDGTLPWQILSNFLTSQFTISQLGIKWPVVLLRRYFLGLLFIKSVCTFATKVSWMPFNICLLPFRSSCSRCSLPFKVFNFSFCSFKSFFSSGWRLISWQYEADSHGVNKQLVLLWPGVWQYEHSGNLMKSSGSRKLSSRSNKSCSFSSIVKLILAAFVRPFQLYQNISVSVICIVLYWGIQTQRVRLRQHWFGYHRTNWLKQV